MRSFLKKSLAGILVGCFVIFSMWVGGASKAMAFATPKAVFDVNKMGDMSDFDPNNPVIPTGDTIKIAVVASHSGPAAIVGQMYWMNLLWVAHDINKRGGILVDGKKEVGPDDQGGSYVQAGPGKEDLRKDGPAGKSSCHVGYGRQQPDEDHQRDGQ